MTFRTISELIKAQNDAVDLVNLATNFLLLYRKYANGCNGVVIPDVYFTTVIMPMKSEDKLSVGLVYTKSITWSEPTYYDVDSESFSEGFGTSNVSGYVSKSQSKLCELFIDIPINYFFLSKDKIIEKLKEVNDKCVKEKARNKAKEEIKILEQKIKKLKQHV